MDDLTTKHCVPCEGGDSAVSDEREEQMLKLGGLSENDFIMAAKINELFI